MSRMLKMLAIVPLLIFSAGCAKSTTETVRSVSNFCLIAKGISYSEAHEGDVEDTANKYDTPETVEQIKAHDRAYEVTCPPR